MIDDADLQPEVVHPGERPGRPQGGPAPAAPHEAVVPLFPPTICSRVQRAWFAHRVAHHVFILRGLYTQGPGPGQGKGRRKWDRFDECGQKSPEQRGEDNIELHHLTGGGSRQLVSRPERPALFRSLSGRPPSADPGDMLGSSEDVKSMRPAWLREREQDLPGF